jgi:hypothetical protein
MENEKVKTGSHEYYLHQMEKSLLEHGETRVKWSWAIERAKEWRELAEQFANAHYVLAPDIRAAKHREALRTYENLIRRER